MRDVVIAELRRGGYLAPVGCCSENNKNVSVTIILLIFHQNCRTNLGEIKIR